MARGFDWLLLAANAGHAPAMGIVGAIVRHGERGVVAQNVTAARTWFEQGVLRKVDQQLDMPKSCVAGAWLSSGSNNRPRTRTKLAF